MEAFDARGRHTEKNLISSFDKLQQHYPQAVPGSPDIGYKLVKFSQHCELTLALAVNDRHKVPSTVVKIEIGVSKASCAWCNEFLCFLKAAAPQNLSIVHRADHDKQPDGWLLPPAAAENVKDAMIHRISQKVDAVIWTVNNRRGLSDSAELSRVSSNIADEKVKWMKPPCF